MVSDSPSFIESLPLFIGLGMTCILYISMIFWGILLIYVVIPFFNYTHMISLYI